MMPPARCFVLRNDTANDTGANDTGANDTGANDIGANGQDHDLYGSDAAAFASPQNEARPTEVEMGP